MTEYKSPLKHAEEYLSHRATPEPMSGCWLWEGYTDTIGYGRVGKGLTGENKAHRVIWVLFNGPIPEGMKILHKCDVRSCVNPNHLFLGTQADNVLDMTRKGRGRCVPQPGESNPMSKLTWQKVREIRAMEAAGLKQITIARKFGMSPMAISRVINQQSWKE